MNKVVYLDYNATTPVAPEVLQAMLPYFQEDFGNPSSIHGYGQRAKAALYEARERVANLIGARSNELLFTSGGTESDNLALLGVVEAAAGRRRRVIVSTVEHHAVLHCAKRLAKKGWPVSFLKVNTQGRVEPEELERQLSDDTLLVSVMHANNETGVVQPVSELARLAHAAGAYFHTDAVQSAAKIPVRVNELGVDLLSVSGHKFYGPKGTGALFVRRGIDFRGVFVGGGQERSRRPGTENLAGIVGLGCAAELALQTQPAESRRLEALRDELEESVLTRIEGARVNGAGAERTPNTVNFSFENVEGEALTLALDLTGYAISTGAACSSGQVEPSHVLIAMGLKPERVQGSIRISLGTFVSSDTLHKFAEVLPGVVETVRRRPAGMRGR